MENYTFISVNDFSAREKLSGIVVTTMIAVSELREEKMSNTATQAVANFFRFYADFSNKVISLDRSLCAAVPDVSVWGFVQPSTLVTTISSRDWLIKKLQMPAKHSNK